MTIGVPAVLEAPLAAAVPDSRVVDGIGAGNGGRAPTAYEASLAAAIAADGADHAGGSAIERAGRARRAALLATLPLGDLTGKVCAHFGVGTAGFGGAFPALRECGYAVGIDVSLAAVEAAARSAAGARWPYGDRYVYLASRGDALRLRDGSVDLFYAAERVQQVENVEAFLDEVHRVLRPDGVVILTATNADAYLYRVRGERHCPSADHLSLMSWAELAGYLEPRFEVVAARGCNASLYPEWDAAIADESFAAAWAAQPVDRPDLATDVVVLARRREGHRRGRCRQQSFPHDGPAVAWDGPWAVAPVHREMTARMGTGGDRSALAIDFDGTDLLVFFWSHPWSGHAVVEVDGVSPGPVDLYGRQSGFRRVHLGGLAPGRHRLTIRGSAHHDPRSRGDQLLFYQAIAYTRLDERGNPMSSTAPAPPVDHNFATRPARFGVVYTTPAHMTASERVLVYSLVFGVRPRRCLEIGTHKGGSALIIGAALDDLGDGTLVCVDPQPMVAPEHWGQIAHRATMIAGPSPDVLPRALEVAGGPFDFALIDGDHQFPGVVRDIEGVLDVLAPSAYLLFHDANYHEVRQAIDEMLCKYADRLVDCGMLSVQQVAEDRFVDGHRVVWGGLRLLRYHRPG